MRDDDEDRLLLAVQVEQQLADGLGGVAVEVAGRLVGQQQDRLVDQRPGDGHALPLAAGQLGRAVVEPAGQADAVEQLTGPLSDGRRGRRR